MTAIDEQAERDAIREFCPGCFADDLGGSWNHTTQGGYCNNCGAGGTVQIPVWAVESIRKQASWVGKRYYPADEDLRIQRELKYHRSLAELPPDRTAKAVEVGEEDGYWSVVQPQPGGTIQCSVKADSAEEALQKTKDRLPWPAAFEEPA